HLPWPVYAPAAACRPGLCIALFPSGGPRSLVKFLRDVSVMQRPAAPARGEGPRGYALPVSSAGAASPASASAAAASSSPPAASAAALGAVSAGPSPPAAASSSAASSGSYSTSVTSALSMSQRTA